MCPKIVDEVASSVDPDQTDLALHCLLMIRPACPKTWDPYGISFVLMYHE